MPKWDDILNDSFGIDPFLPERIWGWLSGNKWHSEEKFIEREKQHKNISENIIRKS